MDASFLEGLYVGFPQSLTKDLLRDYRFQRNAQILQV